MVARGIADLEWWLALWQRTASPAHLRNLIARLTAELLKPNWTVHTLYVIFVISHGGA